METANKRREVTGQGGGGFHGQASAAVWPPALPAALVSVRMAVLTPWGDAGPIRPEPILTNRHHHLPLSRPQRSPMGNPKVEGCPLAQPRGPNVGYTWSQSLPVPAGSPSPHAAAELLEDRRSPASSQDPTTQFRKLHCRPAPSHSAQ